MRLVTLVVALGLIVAVTDPAVATQKRLAFERFTVEEGLPENSVRAILQDRQGFLWFGTQAGIARYDGYEMIQRWHATGDSTSVPRLLVSALCQDDDGWIWIGTMLGGLWRMDPRTESFERISCVADRPSEKLEVRDLALDPGGGVWVAWGGQGICRHGPDGACTAALRHDPAQPGSLPDDDINAVLVDSRGGLWVGTRTHGVARRPAGRDDFVVRRADPESPAGLPHDQINSIYESEDGRVWVSTYRGLACWLPQRKEFRSYVPDPNERMQDVNYLLQMVDAADGGMWIGSAVGLYHFDPIVAEFQLYAHDPGDPKSPVKGPVLSVFRDRSGVVWAGSWHAGMNKLDPEATKFVYERHDPDDPRSIDDDAVMAVLEDTGGTLWVGTGTQSTGGSNGGLNRRTAQGFERVEFPSARVRAVQALTEDAAGRIWAGTNAGLWRVDPGATRAQRVFESENSDLGIGDEPVRGLIIDREGEVWVCVFRSGLYRINPVTGAIRHYEHDPENQNSLSQDQLIFAYEDTTGRIWIGTDTAGLNLYRPGTDDFERYIDPERGLTTLVDMFEDSRGLLWIGTFAGLLQFDAGSGRVVDAFTSERGLPNDLVASILEDRAGRLWVSTGRGVARIDVATGSVRSFDVRDGLPGNQQSYARYGARDGTIYFGSHEGLIHFRPDEIIDRAFEPRVLLTSLLVADQIQSPRSGGLLAEGVSYAPRVELSHLQNDLTFKFAALDYTHPGRTRYRYRLVNYDDDWRDAHDRRSATYTNLYSGDYRFEVMGTNADGVWSSSVGALDFVVRPPWWSSTIAMMFYVLASIGMAAFIYHQIVQRERAQAALVVQQSEARQLQRLDEFKTRFFANISHEFRTPLTLIQAPLTRLESDPDGGDRVLFGMMARNARRLRELIDQLLDLARLDARRLPLRWREGDWLAYLRVLVASFDSFGQDHQVRLTHDFPEDLPRAWYDADVLEKVVGNLLSNAIRYTPHGGEVHVRVNLRAAEEPVPVPLSIGDPDTPSQLTQLASWLTVEVSNTGSYIPPAERVRIFDRFHQIGGRTAEGSGVGLSLVKELVEWMHGSIDVVSSRETGTSFVATLPLFHDPPVTGLEKEAVAEEIAEPLLARSALAGSGDHEPESLPVPAVANETPLVLVVEDNDDMRAFLKQGLRDRYRVIAAADGDEGLRLALEEVPDLVLSDVIMPGMDGMELSRRIKDDERTSHIPIILLTARTEGESRKEGLQTGADDYLGKPFDPEELLIRIDNLIEQRRRLAEKYASQISGLAHDAMPVTSADERFLVRARGVVEEHLDDEDLDVATLCREIGISRAQLHRKLKSLTGQSTSEFVRTHRLQRASELLDGRFGNVTEIAFAVGFQSQSYFARCFRQQYGMSPSEYLDRG